MFWKNKKISFNVNQHQVKRSTALIIGPLMEEKTNICPIHFGKGLMLASVAEKLHSCWLKFDTKGLSFKSFKSLNFNKESDA